MPDNEQGRPPKKQGAPNKSTVDIYKELVHVEVRALVGRVSELTQTIGDVFTEVTALALQLEESSGKVDQLSTSLSYCREEITKLKTRVDAHATKIGALSQGGEADTD